MESPLSLNLVSAVVFHWHLPVVTHESTCSSIDDVIHVIWILLLFVYFWSRLKSLYGSKIAICQFEAAFKEKIDSIFCVFCCNINDWVCISLMLFKIDVLIFNYYTVFLVCDKMKMDGHVIGLFSSIYLYVIGMILYEFNLYFICINYFVEMTWMHKI